MIGISNGSLMFSSNTRSPIGSYINVRYPAGSVCTCTNGSITFTAPNTSGAITFYIPSTGSWTITSIDGTDSSSETVTVASNQTYEVNLTYFYYLYSLDYNINRLGTMTMGTNPGSTNGETSVVFVAGGMRVQTVLAGARYPKCSDYTYDLSLYKQLVVTLTWTTHTGYEIYAGFCDNQAGNYSNHNWHTYAPWPYATTLTRQVVLDLSNENRTGYFYIFGTGNDGSSPQIVNEILITELYLVPKD